MNIESYIREGVLIAYQHCFDFYEGSSNKKEFHRCLFCGEVFLWNLLDYSEWELREHNDFLVEDETAYMILTSRLKRHLEENHGDILAFCLFAGYQGFTPEFFCRKRDEYGE